MGYTIGVWEDASRRAGDVVQTLRLYAASNEPEDLDAALEHLRRLGSSIGCALLFSAGSKIDFEKMSESGSYPM